MDYMSCLKSNKLTFLYMVLKKRRRLVLLQDTNFFTFVYFLVYK